MIAEVIVDIYNKQVNRLFDYKIPSHLENIIKIGFRVKVKFNNQIKVAYVINIKDKTEYKNNLKEIIDIVDVNQILDLEMVNIAKYISINYFNFFAKALDLMIPQALKIKYQKIAKVINKELLNDELKEIFKNKKELIIDNLSLDKQKIIYKNINSNLILDTKLKKTKDSNLINMVHLNDINVSIKGKRQKELYDYLKELDSDLELDIIYHDLNYSKSIVDSLINLGVIKIYQKEIKKNEEIDILDIKHELNYEQQNVYNSIKLNEYNTYLLHGITGSGKTEIYMHLILDVINSGKKVIMLVPEISLTPQITALFYARFKKNIAILHSRLSTNEKYQEWKRIINGEINIVIGARSAIFAPLKNIGLIIIDEEHESSYIQKNNPKYDAKEIAKLRAKYHNAPLLLASATPDIKDYFYAINGDYKLLKLLNRANGKKQEDSLVIDMREELKNKNLSPLSNDLKNKLKDRYKKKEQSILFLNRRGYSNFVMCRMCGEVITCPHCDVALTYHKNYNQEYLECHYCGYKINNPSVCPKCNSDKIRFVGSGTEKIYDEVKKLIPEANVLRLDMDTMNNISDYQDSYELFKNHEADILIGTQMITKGLDFPLVTLVGVLNADLALKYPMYDSNMIAYNLIEQVSGRSGRDKLNGEVIIQTYNPDHFIIKFAKVHDYESFYKYEIERRMLQNLPPFSEMITIEVTSKDASLAYDEAKMIVDTLKDIDINSQILGPVEAPIFKKNDYFRFVITILALSDKIIDKINYLYPLYQNNKDVSLDITRE